MANEGKSEMGKASLKRCLRHLAGHLKKVNQLCQQTLWKTRVLALLLGELSMANPWFRLYAEFAADPKVQIMSEVMQRRLVMLFCLRCSNDLVTLQDEEIAFHLRISNEELAETKSLFESKGFIDAGWNIHQWEKRQFVSDSSAARVARHRDKKRNGAKQACNVTVTPPDTDTDTEAHTSLRSACESAHESKTGTGIAIPGDFTPDRIGKLKAGELNLDATLETERFIAHHQAQHSLRNDQTAWQAQFRKWLLDQAQFNADRSRVTDARVKAATGKSNPEDARRAACDTLGVGSKYLTGGQHNAYLGN